MKIRPAGAELFHADGRTDRYDEADSRSSKFLRKYLNTYFLPHNTHCHSPLQKSIVQHVRVMLLRETMAVTSENRTKHTNMEVLASYRLNE